MKTGLQFAFAALLALQAPFAPASLVTSPPANPPRVQIRSGVLQGVSLPSRIQAYLGIPYAAPPVGEFRWREPATPISWEGVRIADHFGPHAMQRFMWSDMMFRSEMSEDCLYLNVWAPEKAGQSSLPVLVYFHGGGLVAGSGDEPRYDGANLAGRGLIVVTVNYRLGIFGFFAHPELTRESGHQSSGNYGFLDQAAALRWVHDNIAAFGGNPDKVTIGGQSAGASSVSAQMTSLLSRGLFRGVIAQSGSILAGGSRGWGARPLAYGEQWGQRLAASLGATSMKALREMAPERILSAMDNSEFAWPSPVVDGYFLREDPHEVLVTGRQADVPLLVGSTSAEQDYRAVLGDDAPSRDGFDAALRKIFGSNYEQAKRAYPCPSDVDAAKAATLLASDMFAGYRAWKLGDLHSKSSGSPVFGYLWDQLLPPRKGETTPASPPAWGAPHSAELPYLFGTLGLVDSHQWTADDFQASETFQAFVAQFVKTGNPNPDGLKIWPWIQASTPAIMILKSKPQLQNEDRYARFGVIELLVPGKM